MDQKSALRVLDTLERSKGWVYVKDVMNEEILTAAAQIAEHRKMEIDEINFRRGAIWAAQRLLDLPDRLRLRLENEVALTSAKAEMENPNGTD